MGTHGFHTWAESKEVCIDPRNNEPCDGVDMLGPCADKGGPKWITKELEYYTAGGYISSHHPSTAWHLLRGEIMAYNYIHVLLDAMYTFKKDQLIHPSYQLKHHAMSKLGKFCWLVLSRWLLDCICPYDIYGVSHL